MGSRIARFTLEKAFQCLARPLKKSQSHPAWDVMAGNGVITATMLDDPQVTEVYASDVDKSVIERLKQVLTDNRIQIFRHNILGSSPRNIANDRLHIAVVDPPYDHQCHWLDDNDNQVLHPKHDDQQAMLELAFQHISRKLCTGGVIALMHKMHFDKSTLEEMTEADLVEQHRLTSGGSNSYLHDRNLYLLRKN